MDGLPNSYLMSLFDNYNILDIFQDGVITFEEFRRVLQNADMEKISMKFPI